MSEEYLKEVVLPSRGLFYDGQIPHGVVTVEPMGTREEKLFASAKAGASRLVDKIFNSCVHSPVPHEKLILGDRLFLLLQLRVVSYGEMYSYPFRCSDCGAKVYVEVNLDEIPINYADESGEYPFRVELPIKKDVLELRLLTGKDEENVSRYGKSLTSKAKGPGGNSAARGAEHVFRLARRVSTINGEIPTIKEAMVYMEALKGMDTIAVRDAIAEYNVGPDMNLEPECSSCGYANGPFVLPFDVEFFRPRRRSPKAPDYLRAAEAFDDERPDVSGR